MAIFGRKTARQRLRSAARESLSIPAFSTPTDCTPWVVGGLWPAELTDVTDETATLADYLSADLQRIVKSANQKLQAIRQADLAGSARREAEARVIEGARTFAVLRVESTVRQLRDRASTFPAGYLSVDLAPEPGRGHPGNRSEPTRTEGTDGTPAGEPVRAKEPETAEPAEPDADAQRLHRLLEFVARQEPGLRWAIGTYGDGTTLLVTDLAHGWIPPGIELPAGVRLAEPGWRDGAADALLGPAKLSATYAPGDRLSRATDLGTIAPSALPRELAPIDDLARLLAEATHSRDGLPGVVTTLARAGAAGTGVADAEVDLLRVHLDTARYQLLAQYPHPDTALVLNCMLLAATAGIATGDAVGANYHFAWFQALSSPPAGLTGQPTMN